MTASPRRHISPFSLLLSLGSRLSHCTPSQAVLNCATAITVERFLMDSRAASLLSKPKRVAASTISSLAVPLSKSSWTAATCLSSCWRQSIVWARSGSESVLLTTLLKKIRESGVSIDDAAQACHSAAVPDKHKEAMWFMEPPAQDLLKCLEAKAPIRNHEAADELAKAKATLAEHGIVMSPVKRKRDQESEPSNSTDKRAKPTLPRAEPEAQSEAQQLLSDSYRKLDSRPKGASNEHVADWLAGFKTKPEFKGKYLPSDNSRNEKSPINHGDSIQKPGCLPHLGRRSRFSVTTQWPVHNGVEHDTPCRQVFCRNGGGLEQMSKGEPGLSSELKNFDSRSSGKNPWDSCHWCLDQSRLCHWC